MMKILIVLLFLFIPPVHAGIYKWTDSDGNVHFGDRPANPSTATEIDIRDDRNTGVTTSSGNNKERRYLLEQIEEDKQAEAEKKKKRLAENKKRRKLCDNYRRRYQSLIQSSRSYRMSPDGVRTYLSEDERVAQRKKLKRKIKEYCR